MVDPTRRCPHLLVTVTLSRATDQAQGVVGQHLFPPCRKAVLPKASEELWPFQGCIWADQSVRLEQKWWGVWDAVWAEREVE